MNDLGYPNPLSWRVLRFLGIACLVSSFLIYPTVSFGKKIKEIKIGVIEALSGPVAPIGRLNLGGCEVAVDEINSNGGIKSLGGAHLTIVHGDTEGRPEIGMSATERVIQKGVVALIGAYQSSVTFVTTQVAERFKIPFIVPVSIGEEITERGFRYTFRTGQNPEQAMTGEVDLVNFLNTTTNTPARRIAIFSEDTLAGQSMEKWRRKLFTEAGFEIVASVFYPSTTRDLSAEVSKLKSAKPDFVLRQCYLSDAMLLTRTMYELDCNVMGMAGTAGEGESRYISELGKLSEFTFLTSMWDPRIKIQGVKEAAAHYKEKIGETMEYKAATYYSAVFLLKDALERSASTNSDSIRDALAETDLKAGEKGNINAYGIKFDEKGQNIRARVVSGQIINSQFTYIYPEKYAETKPVFPVPKWADRDL